MLDFTIATYRKLLDTLIEQDYSFLTVSEFLHSPAKRTIILRHDVDALPLNSLNFAKIQFSLGIRGSYYFRIFPGSYDEKIISEIASLGHEIGYHYETMNTSRGDIDKAWHEFRRNLDIFRRIVPVSSISMHGSPRSKLDNRDLWKKYDYRSLGIIAEPYFDIDFSEVMYLTDTGRRWDGSRFIVRDRVMNRQAGNPGLSATDAPPPARPVRASTSSPAALSPGPEQFPVFHSTSDIIEYARMNRLPDKIMLTFHPQRWTDQPGPWLRELVWQNVKNKGKYFLVKLRSGT
jgi:hypothetical protein